MQYTKVQATNSQQYNLLTPSQLFALAAVFVSSTLAAPLDIEVRACASTCGSHCYSSSAVAAAQNAGYDLYSESSTADSYPHVYHNYEGFTFPVSGTYYEFPILSGGSVYSGGSPGADRVIFNTDNQLAGVITHTGASGNNFVECT
jgi:ribonuclease T1